MFEYGFPYQQSFLPGEIYLSESLEIFLSLDVLMSSWTSFHCYVVCNSEVIQIVMIVNHMHEIVIFCGRRPFMRMNWCLCLSMVFTSSESLRWFFCWLNLLLCSRFLISTKVLSWFCHFLHSSLVVGGFWSIPTLLQNKVSFCREITVFPAIASIEGVSVVHPTMIALTAKQSKSWHSDLVFCYGICNKASAFTFDLPGL